MDEMDEVFRQRVDQLDCTVCRKVAPRVCTLIPDTDGKLECVDAIGQIADPEGDWVGAVKAMKDAGVYDQFVHDYAMIRGDPPEAFKTMLDNIESFQRLRDAKRDRANNSAVIEMSDKMPEVSDNSAVIEVSEGDGREGRFYKYNMDNIMSNIHQLEQHLRDITDEDLKTGHGQCIVKHSSMIIGETDEAMSHVAEVGDEKYQRFRGLRDAMKDFKDTLGDRSARENILAIRALRKEYEKLDPSYDTSKCKACNDGAYQYVDIEPEPEKITVPSPDRISDADRIIENINRKRRRNMADMDRRMEDFKKDMEEPVPERRQVGPIPIIHRILDPLGLFPQPFADDRKGDEKSGE